MQFLRMGLRSADGDHSDAVVHTQNNDVQSKINKKKIGRRDQSFIYSPIDAPVSCLKETILKFTLKQL